MKFARLAEVFDRLEETSSRNAMVETLAEAFKEATPQEADKMVYLSQGRLLPPFVPLEFGVGEAAVRSALATVAGADEAAVRVQYKELGDYGTVAAQLLGGHGSAGASVAEVYEALDGVARASGSGSQAQKRELIVALFRRLSAQEAKHVARVLMGRLRLGIGDATVMEGLSFSRVGSKADRKALERAYNLCSDLGLVARTYLGGGDEALAQIRVHAGNPVRPALCERVASPEELVERLGPCAVEPKIDGFRCQVHKRGDEVRAFSRNLEDMSEMFPEIVEAIREQARGRDVILEGEAVGYDPGTLEFHPFQVTVTRKRKHDIETLREELPLKLLAFDLLYEDGEDLTPLSYVARRERLLALLGEAIAFDTPGAAAAGPTVQPNEARQLNTADEVEAYFATTVERGQEGIVAKRLESAYQAGARNYNWIKLKRSYRGELKDTVDCVVVGYWRGRGNRAKLGIGTLLTAVYDPERDMFTTVTRLGTGFSEEEWARLREMLDAARDDAQPARVDSLITPDVWVKPQYVIEIQADEITRSPMHTTGRATLHTAAAATGETQPSSSVEEGGDGGPTAGGPGETGDGMGYALRFPRVLGFVRADKRPEDATTVDEIVTLYRKQGRQQVAEAGA